MITGKIWKGNEFPMLKTIDSTTCTHDKVLVEIFMRKGVTQSLFIFSNKKSFMFSKHNFEIQA